MKLVAVLELYNHMVLKPETIYMTEISENYSRRHSLQMSSVLHFPCELRRVHEVGLITSKVTQCQQDGTA